MAFPTSSLTNNQVHKEGNRAFVYDSALGVWDQVRETDRTENKILSGEIGGVVTFPTGHVIQTVHNNSSSQFDVAGFSAGAFGTTGFSCSITPKSTTSKILFTFDGGWGSSSGNTTDNWFFLGFAVSGSSITNTNIGIDATNPLVRSNPNTGGVRGLFNMSANFLYGYNQNNTTDALTFTIHLGSQAAYSAGHMHLGGRTDGESQYSMMTLMEIAQ